MLKGIDVSKHDGVIDWQKVKNSGQVDFVIIRAGYGKLASQKDVQFERNYSECKKYGIPVGAYWYSYAHSVEEMKQEANVFLSVIKGKQFEYPIYLDFEEKSQFNMGKNACISMAKAFLKVLEDNGCYAGMYCSSSYLKNYFDDSIKNNYTIWVAHYGVSKPTYTGPYDIWQYTSEGTIPGINHRCDLNYSYKTDFPETIKKAGLNGFKAEQQNQELKPIDEIVKEVFEGKWGNGADRKARLSAAGYNYDEIQKAVNKALEEKEEVKEEVKKEKKQITIILDDKKYNGTIEEE
jgi:GH25 family lysozyme M1 (1,4-beta-N-acetylmuramidase)